MPPTPEELRDREVQGLGGVALTIETDRGNDEAECYVSLVLPARDPTRQPESVSDWGWETLAQFALPIHCVDLLITTLHAIQRLRHPQSCE